MTIQVKEVKDKRALEEFVSFPIELHKKNPFYAFPLIKDMLSHLSKKNPFFKRAEAKFFLAYKNGIPAGRIAGIVNYAHNEFHQDYVGFFGLFDCLNDMEVAKALFDEVANYLILKGLKSMRGPMNLSTNEECGFLCEGFDEPSMIMIPYNPPYYNELAKNYGMEKAKDLYCFLTSVPSELPSKIDRISQLAEKKGIKARKVNMKNLKEELYAFREVYNEAWRENWGFIPITKEEIDYMAERLKPIVIEDLVIIAEANSEPVGFFGAIPDFNEVLRRIRGRLTPFALLKALYYKRKIEGIRLLLFGVKKDFRHKGVESIMIREAFKAAKRYGFKKAEFSWILEDNFDTINLTQVLNARKYKTLRIYEKRLS